MPDSAVNILVLRRVRPEMLEAFEARVREWIPRSIQHPGHMGVFLIQPGPGSDEHGALLRFRTAEDWERFKSWEAYRGFIADLRPMLLAEPRVEALHGMEAWFRGTTAPPRWKMAVLTWLGVNGMVLLAGWCVGMFAGGWPRWVVFLSANAFVVAGLTWVVMPVLIKLAQPWLAGRSR